MPLMRLQKFLAQCGIASRRKCEELIMQGRVSVNGRVTKVLGLSIETSADKVFFDGRPVELKNDYIYIALNKPVGHITTSKDTHGRNTVIGLIPKCAGRVFAVGRLDKNSEGLLVLTNDGALAHRLMHPSFGVEKRYEVSVAGKCLGSDIERLRKGILLDGKMTAPCSIKRFGQTAYAGNEVFEVILHEGKKRQIRRMFLSIGATVIKLKRTGYGPVLLRNLRPGKFRNLSEIEISQIKKEAGLL